MGCLIAATMLQAGQCKDVTLRFYVPTTQTRACRNALPLLSTATFVITGRLIIAGVVRRTDSSQHCYGNTQRVCDLISWLMIQLMLLLMHPSPFEFVGVLPKECCL
jgi:hypothetical protein